MAVVSAICIDFWRSDFQNDSEFQISNGGVLVELTNLRCASAMEKAYLSSVSLGDFCFIKLVGMMYHLGFCQDPKQKCPLTCGKQIQVPIEMVNFSEEILSGKVN